MTPLFCSLAALYVVVMALALYPLYATGKQKVALLLGVLLALPVFGLYALWGAPRVVPLVTAHREHVEELRKTIEMTEALIKANPNNLEAWMTQAQAFADSGDYAKAANSYKQSVLLSKGNPVLIMAYAEAVIMQNDGVVDAQAKKSIDIALMIDEHLPVARYYNAIWLLQNNETEEAMKNMKALYHELPDNSPLKKKINEQIGR